MHGSLVGTDPDALHPATAVLMTEVGLNNLYPNSNTSTNNENKNNPRPPSHSTTASAAEHYNSEAPAPPSPQPQVRDVLPLQSMLQLWGAGSPSASTVSETSSVICRGGAGTGRKGSAAIGNTCLPMETAFRSAPPLTETQTQDHDQAQREVNRNGLNAVVGDGKCKDNHPFVRGLARLVSMATAEHGNTINNSNQGDATIGGSAPGHHCDGAGRDYKNPSDGDTAINNGNSHSAVEHTSKETPMAESGTSTAITTSATTTVVDSGVGGGGDACRSNGKNCLGGNGNNDNNNDSNTVHIDLALNVNNATANDDNATSSSSSNNNSSGLVPMTAEGVNIGGEVTGSGVGDGDQHEQHGEPPIIAREGPRCSTGDENDASSSSTTTSTTIEAIATGTATTATAVSTTLAEISPIQLQTTPAAAPFTAASTTDGGEVLSMASDIPPMLQEWRWTEIATGVSGGDSGGSGGSGSGGGNSSAIIFGLNASSLAPDASGTGVETLAAPEQPDHVQTPPLPPPSAAATAAAASIAAAAAAAAAGKGGGRRGGISLGLELPSSLLLPESGSSSGGDGQRRARAKRSRPAVACADPTCKRPPTYGSPGDQRAGYCAGHGKLRGLQNIVTPRCRHRFPEHDSLQTCLLWPAFGWETDKSPTYCAGHALTGMKNINNPKCKSPGCERWPSFGALGTKVALYCHGHKISGMVDVVKPRCQEAGGCARRPSFGWPSDKVLQYTRLFFSDSVLGGWGGAGRGRCIVWCVSMLPAFFVCIFLLFVTSVSTLPLCKVDGMLRTHTLLLVESTLHNLFLV